MFRWGVVCGVRWGKQKSEKKEKGKKKKKNSKNTTSIVGYGKVNFAMVAHGYADRYPNEKKKKENPIDSGRWGRGCKQSK